MSKIKELTAHLRRLIEKNYIVDNELNTVLNQIDIASENTHPVPFQKCPKCDGQGTVSKPPYIAGDVFEWCSSSGLYQCNVCNGAKIISMNLINK